MERPQARIGFRLCVVVVSVLALAAAIPATAQSQSPALGWQFELTPYAWLAGMSGEMGAGPTSAHVSVSFSDVARNVNSGFMAHFEARHGRWGFLVDPIYMDVGETFHTPYGLNLDMKAKQLILGLAGSYTVYQGNASAFDVLFGVCYNHLRSEVALAGTPFPPYVLDKEWLDPLMGFRARFTMGQRWDFGLCGNIGGFSIGSKLWWDAIARFDYRLNKTVAFNLGYAVISTNYESGSGFNYFLYDVRMEGPFVGIAFHF